ncbi:MAG: hypothetical protein JRI72_13690 [Deltaproteobacteria bacterium]|nr:hypothetical protein [Deltaproteobacteria bacterium]
MWVYYISIPAKHTTFAWIPVDLADFSVAPESSVIFEGEGSKAFSLEGASYMGTIIVENAGHGTASDVRLGIGYTFKGVNFTINTSPNVKTEIKSGSSDQESNVQFPSYLEIIVPSLPSKEIAIINLGWRLDDKNTDIFNNAPHSGFMVKKTQGQNWEGAFQSTYFLPSILFANCKEGRGQILARIPFKDINKLGRPDMLPFMRTTTPVGILPPDTYTTRQFEFDGISLKDEKTGIVLQIKSQ